MQSLVVLLTLFVSVSISYADSSFSGLSTIKIEMPKKESITVSAYRYVMDVSQQLSVSCPIGTKLISAGCAGEIRSLEVSSLTGDATSRHIFTKTVVATNDPISTATCNAVLVRPEEFIRLSVSAECLENETFNSVRN